MTTNKPVTLAFGTDFDDDDEWQSMPVEQSSTTLSSTKITDSYANPNDRAYGDEDEEDSDPDDPRRFRSLPSRSSLHSSRTSSQRSAARATGSKSSPSGSSLGAAKKSAIRSRNASDHVSATNTTASKSSRAATNATGKHLDIDDARGYDWRSKPANAADDDDSDDDGERGYTQLRLEEDEEAEQLHAATEYLFQDGSKHDPYGELNTATPLNQMKTTKQLLSEGQKIAYVGLCSLLAAEMVRSIRRVPGKSLDSAKESVDSWKVKVMARLYQHMDIEPSEQRMIESLAEHGVLPTDLAPSLVTTQTIDNPDFDPEALREREEEERQEEQERLQKQQRESEEVRTTQTLQARDPKLDDDAAIQTQSNSTRRASTEDEREDPDSLLPSSGQNPFDEEEFDIGHSLDSPSAAAPSASTTCAEAGQSDVQSTTVGHTRKSSAPVEDYGDIGLHAESDEEADEDGDIGGGGCRNLESAHAADASSKSTGVDGGAPISTASPPTPPLRDSAKTSHTRSVSEATTVVADPNTASQLANAVDVGDVPGMPAPAEEGPGSVTTTLGLTKQPQAVEPPPGALDGVTTSISSADATITLDLRWTVLCDLFLVLTADSVYDARSRVLLERVAAQLGLTWMDVTQFEKRVTDALEIEEGIESLSDQSAIKKRMLMARKKRMLMMGLATVGGGLVIGLSAGLLAPVIGAGVGAALGAVGVSGTSGFLGGVGGAALITSTGTIGGMSLGGHGMSRRTRSVKTFEYKPIHNNKRVNAIVCVPGFMNGPQDDVRLPFSVIDSVMGDAFGVLWEPDMMQEMGNAIGILWNETIVQGVQQVLAATVAGAMFTALAWPLWLTKLGYLIDNPWSNALDRSQAAGLILADTLVKRQLGVRPITLVGYSLGARVIFYALLELSRLKVYGIVQNVYIMGAPITAKDEVWKEARSVVSGRFVSAFSRTDWILGYLHRAASGGLRSIAGLHPVERVQDVENVDVTHVVPGHLGYRPLMPLVLGELGFRVTADYFDEPEDLNAIPERQVVVESKDKDKDVELKTVKTKTGGFGKIFRRKGTSDSNAGSGTSTPARSAPATGTATPIPTTLAARHAEYDEYEDDDLPPRVEVHPTPAAQASSQSGGASGAALSEHPSTDKRRPMSLADEVRSQELSINTAAGAATAAVASPATPEIDRPPSVSAHVDTDAILRELRESGIEVRELESSLPPLVASAGKASAIPAASVQTIKAESREPVQRSVSSEVPRGNGAASAMAPATLDRRESAPGSTSAEQQSLSYAPQSGPATVQPHGSSISLTFASYDDYDEDDDDEGKAEIGMPMAIGDTVAERTDNENGSGEPDIAASHASNAVIVAEQKPDVEGEEAEEADDTGDLSSGTGSGGQRRGGQVEEIDTSAAQSYGMSADAAKELAAKFRGGGGWGAPSSDIGFGGGDMDVGIGSVGRSNGSSSAGGGSGWMPVEDDSWSPARPSTTYDFSAGSSDAMRALGRRPSYGLAGAGLSLGEPVVDDIAGLGGMISPPTSALGRGFDYNDSGLVSLNGLPRRDSSGNTNTTSGPGGASGAASSTTPAADPWADNPW
ncbi:DUF726-domain-containing protein [Testicularia cyperi]|uniref:DUF726-domain-containing protein n=1 Tax=Testicularia cyperi TaxID=1882483 RepID=A0A317XNG4_9BASI|nr:DUF726-domain-containing protein [Testicularia cyperi]